MQRLPHLSLTQVRLVRLFSLLLVFSLLVLYGVFRSTRFQELLRRRTESLLTAKIGRTVTIGGFDLALVPFGFRVRDVSIANDPRGLAGPAFSAAEIEIRGLPTLTKSRLDIPKLRVFAPRVVAEVFADGTTNLAPILAAFAGGGGGGIDVHLAEAVVQRATFRFRDWNAELDAVLQDAALTATDGRSRTVTHLALACRKGRFLLENNETLEFAVGAEVTLSPGRVHLSSLRLRGDRLRLEASGGVDDLRKPVLALVARAETSGETLSRVFGLGLPLAGNLRLRGTMKAGGPGGFRIAGVFDMPAVSLGPLPMSGEGVIRMDPNGLLVGVTRASYAGGTLEGVVQVERLKNPPLPVRITLRTHGLDFERFFADLGLPGTGLLGRADLDTTLSFGRGGIEHADGVGRLRLIADGGRPSAVRGRFALPLGGGGPLEVRDGRLLFKGIPFATAGGARIRVDGSLKLGTWEPDLQFDIAADDLAEIERLADDIYPAIRKEPLTPPLKLGGSGRIVARISRTFADPRIEGRLSATGFVLRGVPFGTASAEFLVDHDVATFSPFTARDESGAGLTLTGKIGWGGSLGDRYRLDGLVADFSSWPIERVLRFLDIDLPITGAGTGRLPLDGVTPELEGRISLAVRNGSVWGQKLDRLDGVLAFAKDRILLEDTTAALDAGRASGSGSYRYADRAYTLDLETSNVPLARLSAADGLPVTGSLSGHVRGSGTVDKPNLEVSASVADAAWSGSPLGRQDRPLEIAASATKGAFSFLVRAPDAAEVRVAPEGKDGRWRARLEVSSLAPFTALLSVPDEARLDGRLVAEAELTPGDKLENLGGEGTVSAARIVAYGHTLELRTPAPVRVSEGKVSVERLTLAESARAEAPGAPPTTLTLAGSAGLAAPHPLDLSLSGSFDASILAIELGGTVAGRVGVDLKASGTASAPALSGRATLDGVDLTTADGAALEAITGTLLFAGDRVSVGDLSVRYSGGTIAFGGFLTLANLKPTSMRLSARVSHVKASPFDGFRGTFSGDLVLLGDTDLRTVRGELVCDKALYDREFSLDIASLLARKRAAVTNGSASRFDPVALDVRLLFPPSSIEVRNNVARLKLAGELFVRGTVRSPLLFGEVAAEDGGRLTLEGQRYDVLSAKILFSNPLRIEPFFELQARGTVSRYQITFGLTGTPTRLAPTFSSDPQLSEAQIVSLMATGDVPQSTVAGAPAGPAPISSDVSVSNAARELLAGLATEAVTSRTRDFFRLDRLLIDPTVTGTSFDAPRIVVGKSLGNNFNATVSFVLSSTQQQIITLDYQLSSAAAIQARLDENGIYSIELRIRQRLR